MQTQRLICLFQSKQIVVVQINVTHVFENQQLLHLRRGEVVRSHKLRFGLESDLVLNELRQTEVNEHELLESGTPQHVLCLQIAMADVQRVQNFERTFQLLLFLCLGHTGHRNGLAVLHAEDDHVLEDNDVVAERFQYLRAYFEDAADGGDHVLLVDFVHEVLIEIHFFVDGDCFCNEGLSFFLELVYFAESTAANKLLILKINLIHTFHSLNFYCIKSNRYEENGRLKVCLCKSNLNIIFPLRAAFDCV